MKPSVFSDDPHRVSLRESVEGLANAVVYQAVIDYEHALSAGETDSRTISDVERFARDGVDAYSEIDLVAVLDELRKAYPRFRRYCDAHGAEIAAETLLNRKKRLDVSEASTHRCPFCGGHLFAYKKVGRRRRIKCSGCYFYRDILLGGDAS